jgi:hypothetical protein
MGKLIIALLSIYLVHSAQAQTEAFSLSELQELSQKMEVVNDSHEFSCPALDSDRSTKLFLFDGAMGFCPHYFLMNMPVGNSPTLQDRLLATPITPENEALITKIKSGTEQELKDKNCHLAKNVLGRFSDVLRVRPFQVLYYSKNGNKESIACAKKLISQSTKSGAPIQFRAMSFSMGGDALLNFAQALEKKQVPIQKVLTIDPVAKGVGWETGVVQTEDNPKFIATKNVAYWANFYQKQDHYCLLYTPFAHFGIRGSYFQNASLNREVLRSEFTSPQAADFGHMNILRQPMVLDAVGAFLE